MIQESHLMSPVNGEDKIWTQDFSPEKDMTHCLEDRGKGDTEELSLCLKRWVGILQAGKTGNETGRGNRIWTALKAEKLLILSMLGHTQNG